MMGAAASAQHERSSPREDTDEYTSRKQYGFRGLPRVKWDHEGSLRVTKPDGSRFGRTTSYKGGAVVIELLPNHTPVDIDATMASAASSRAEGTARNAKPSKPSKPRTPRRPSESTLDADVTAEALSKLPIRVLKKELALRDVDSSDCCEKVQLVSRLHSCIHAERE